MFYCNLPVISDCSAKCIWLQRACYLSDNPLKEETVEGEKSQYTLPDGSVIEVKFNTGFWKEKCHW